MKRRLPQSPPIDVEELLFAYQLAGAVYAGKVAQTGVSHLGVSMLQEDGSVDRINLTDTPLNQAMIAVRDALPQGRFMPVMVRLWALQEALTWPELKSFIRRAASDDHDEVSEAIFSVAAVMPLNAQLNFNRKTFIRRVEKQHAQDDA